MPRVLLVAAIAVSLLGCAGVKHLPEGGERDHGIRYYRSAPYLLVHSDGKGGLITRLLYLPDQTQVMSATPRSNLASIKTALVFQDGVLTSAVEEPDSTGLPEAILTAAEAVLPLLAASMKPGDRFPQPSLYRIVVQGDRLTLIGGEAGAPIHIRLSGSTGAAGGEGP